MHEKLLLKVHGEVASHLQYHVVLQSLKELELYRAQTAGATVFAIVHQS
jgi:hypothetical protein